MFFESIISGRRKLFWIVFHLLLGLVCTYTPGVLIIWFYLVLFTSFNKSLFSVRIGKPFYFVLLISYLVSFEILGRMAHAFPLIPTELSKYMLPMFSILGIIYQPKRVRQDWIIILFSLSISLFFDVSNNRVFFDIINNFFGVIAVCLGITFFSSINFTQDMIFQLMKIILLAILSALVYSFVKTPDFEELSFNLGANSDTAGGAATNQVSTVFGLGLFICFYFIFNDLILTGKRYLDLLIGLAFLGQGLLTFSRGGIIVGVLGIIMLIALSLKRINSKNLFSVLVASVSIIFIFNYIDNFTGGKLLLRYQGETEGTYNYGVEKDLKKITSGRSMIFEEDLKLWSQYPIFGCGVGVSRYVRGGTEEKKVSSHVEFSRLLAEHGISGLIYFVALINLGIKLWKISRIDKTRSLFFILFLIGFLTTFHAAMRTFVTPLLISLSVIGIQNVKKKNEYTIHRSN